VAISGDAGKDVRMIPPEWLYAIRQNWLFDFPLIRSRITA